MNTKMIAVLALGAGLIVLVVTFGLYKHNRAKEAAYVASRHAYEYLAASDDIAQGAKIAAKDLTQISWVSDKPVTGAYSSTNESALIGRVAAYPIPHGMLVLDKFLAAAGSSLSLPNKVPDGMRAIAIKTSPVNDMGGFLFPGAKVDILADIKGPGTNAEAKSYDIAQNITVLATGKQLTPDPSGKPVTVDIVTVLVTPVQAQKLALAQQEGSIYFTLRNGGDTADLTTKPTTLSEITGGSAPRPRPHFSLASVPPLRPVGTPVQTILGGHTVTQYFHGGLPVNPIPLQSSAPSSALGGYQPPPFTGGVQSTTPP